MVDDKLETLTDASPAVQIHLNILQGVIGRMSANSSSCKSWCITLVAGILVVAADKDKPVVTIIMLLPVLLFAALDIYYLKLEKGFRKSYDNFISKMHQRTLVGSDLYSVRPTGKAWELEWEAVKSPSIWAFYVPLVALAIFSASVISRP